MLGMLIYNHIPNFSTMIPVVPEIRERGAFVGKYFMKLVPPYVSLSACFLELGIQLFEMGVHFLGGIYAEALVPEEMIGFWKVSCFFWQTQITLQKGDLSSI